MRREKEKDLSPDSNPFQTKTPILAVILLATLLRSRTTMVQPDIYNLPQIMNLYKQNVTKKRQNSGRFLPVLLCRRTMGRKRAQDKDKCKFKRDETQGMVHAAKEDFSLQFQGSMVFCHEYRIQHNCCVTDCPEA